MNILIKLTCLIGLVIAPILGGHAAADTGAVVNPTSTIQVKANTEDTMDVEKDVTVNMTSDEGVFTAEVVTETKLDGATQKETKIFTGTEAEVMAKIEAMKIINEIEDDGRGPYGGAVGQFGFNGDCTFAIPIRSLFIKGEKAFAQTCGGIVYDSDPEKEYVEIERKLEAMKIVLKQFEKKTK